MLGRLGGDALAGAMQVVVRQVVEFQVGSMQVVSIQALVTQVVSIISGRNSLTNQAQAGLEYLCGMQPHRPRVVLSSPPLITVIRPIFQA